MKKRIVLVLCCCIMLSIVGCESSEESNTQDTPKPEETVVQDKEEEQSQAEDTVSQEEQNQSGQTEAGTQTEDKKTEVMIYKIDPDSGELITEIKECVELNEGTLWEYLIEAGAVPEGSKVHSFVKEGEQLELDVDSTFGEWLRSFGTTGEQEIMSCVVNTYLDAYGAQTIKITEDGQTLRSGNMEYEDYIEKY